MVEAEEDAMTTEYDAIVVDDTMPACQRARDEHAMDGFVSVMTGTVPPTDFFAPENVGQILTGAERGAVA